MRYSTIHQLALIKVSGADAKNFLQGQLTNDVSQLGVQWHFSGYCSPKGRLLALLRLWQSEENYYALVASDIVEVVCKRLRMYVLRSKVEVAVLVNANIIFLGDKQALSQFKPRFKTQFKTKLDELVHHESQRRVLQDEDSFLLCDPATKNYLYIETQPVQDIDHLEETDLAWHRSNIEAGIPQINAASSELFVPQMINLDLLDGINFKKGCYTGQEIVARMHYLGKLKQRLLLCDVEGQANFEAQIGDKVFADDAFSKNTGTLLAIDSDAGIALAVMRISELDSQHLLESGQRLSVRKQQPYPIPL